MVGCEGGHDGRIPRYHTSNAEETRDKRSTQLALTVRLVKMRIAGIHPKSANYDGGFSTYAYGTAAIVN